MKSTVVVTGATGVQGGGVVNALLEHPDAFHIRAITRNAASNKAEELTQKGVEVVQGDLNDHNSLVQASSSCLDC